MSSKYTATSQPKGKKTLTIVYKDGVEIARRLGRKFTMVQIARANRATMMGYVKDAEGSLAKENSEAECERLRQYIAQTSKRLEGEPTCFVAGYANTSSFDTCHNTRELAELVKVEFLS